MNFANFWVRLACRFFISIAKKKAQKIRERDPAIDEMDANKYTLCRIFKGGAPLVIVGETDFPEPKHGLVIGFNHPSLGEIIRLMYLCMAYYPDQTYLFPVNLIWYEALVPVIDELRQYGFELTPIITPSARRKLLKHTKTIEARARLNILTQAFAGAYVDRCAEFVENGQIVLVAPSATRKKYLFDSAEISDGKKPIEPATMTMLTLKLRKAKIEEYGVVPVAIIPPKFSTKGLNLFRNYKFAICAEINAETVAEECGKREAECNARCIERSFMKRIASKFKLYKAESRIVKPD